MPEFVLPSIPRDRDWIELRERLARAAHDMHFCAISNEATNSAALLTIAADIARLARSIPVCGHPMPLGGPVDAGTLYAAQIEANDDADD